MALQIWLPLNGNADSLGLANFQPAAADVEYAESGKIGAKCYANGNLTMDAAQTTSIFNNDSLTISFWIKPINAATPHIIFGNDTNRQFSLFQYSGNAASYPHGLALHWDWRWAWASGINYNSDGTTSSTTATWLGNVFSENEWSHVCVTYQRPVMKIYVNGILKATRTRRSSADDFTSFSYTTNLLTNQSISSRNLNDLRVYDHCLSSNEVKILSQGLVAHYKLTNFDHVAGYDHSGCNYNLTLVGTILNDSDSPRYLSSVNFNNSGYYKKDDFNLTTEQFTCSFWIKPPISTNSQHFLLGTHNTNWAPTNGFCMWRDTNATVYNYALCANDLSFIQGAININPGQWQHLVFVYNGTKLLGYKNGDIDNPILNITYGNNKPIYHSHCYLGNSTYRQAPTDEIDEASMSDFRFYVTALSIDDIKRLYQTPISLSRTGTLNAIEYIEHNDTINNFQKTGIVSFNKITDYNLTNAVNIDDWDETKDLPLAEKMQIFANRIQSTDFIEW